MINYSRLDSVTAEVKADLEQLFPQERFTLKPYYMGMGYCGLSIVIEGGDTATATNVQEYYDGAHAGKFKSCTVTSSEEIGDWNVGEIRVWGGQGDCFNPCAKNDE